MTDRIKFLKTLDFTHEELDSVWEVGNYVKEKIADALEEISNEFTPEIYNGKIDLRIIVEMIPRQDEVND